jgi:hypothetical protein
MLSTCDEVAIQDKDKPINAPAYFTSSMAAIVTGSILAAMFCWWSDT